MFLLFEKFKEMEKLAKEEISRNPIHSFETNLIVGSLWNF